MLLVAARSALIRNTGAHTHTHTHTHMRRTAHTRAQHARAQGAVRHGRKGGRRESTGRLGALSGLGLSQTGREKASHAPQGRVRNKEDFRRGVGRDALSASRKNTEVHSTHKCGEGGGGGRPPRARAARGSRIQTRELGRSPSRNSHDDVAFWCVWAVVVSRVGWVWRQRYGPNGDVCLRVCCVCAGRVSAHVCVSRAQGFSCSCALH